VAFLRASAVQRIRSRLNVIAMLLLLLVTAGGALQLLWLLLSTPNPTYVTNLADDGPGSLRQAIDVASPGSTIAFAPGLRGTIVLTAKDVDISKDLNIRGPGIAIYDKISKSPIPIENGNGIGESIVAENHAHISSNISGVITSHGYNLFQAVSPSTIIVPFNMRSTDLDVSASTVLGIDSTLRYNGGQTPTLSLFPGSPAIDRIPSAACQSTGITTDQRGVKRPRGNGCDIGAYEYIPSP